MAIRCAVHFGLEERLPAALRSVCGSRALRWIFSFRDETAQRSYSSILSRGAATMNRIVVLIVAGVLYPVSVRADGQTAVLNAAAENTIQQLERQCEDALLKDDQVAIDR